MDALDPTPAPEADRDPSTKRWRRTTGVAVLATMLATVGVLGAVGAGAAETGPDDAPSAAGAGEAKALDDEHEDEDEAALNACLADEGVDVEALEALENGADEAAIDEAWMVAEPAFDRCEAALFGEYGACECACDGEHHDDEASEPGDAEPEGPDASE